MAKFLNTDLINEWIPRLISESEKELFIIVPYIQTSERMFKHLFEANKRGVETTIIYRENKLPEKEKLKLFSLDNLNLMHHPNVHAKLYYNEKYMIICSMNLYEYSERNNREMGVLLEKRGNESSFDGDGKDIFEDAIEEIQVIVNSSNFEKHSRETISEGFEMDIIKTQWERIEEECKKLSKIFVHKKFVPFESNLTPIPGCVNYFDRIDLTITHRANLSFTYPEERILEIFKKFKPFYHELRFEGFKFYWSNHYGDITLYRNSKDKRWNHLSYEEDMRMLKTGIDEVISFLRQFI